MACGSQLAPYSHSQVWTPKLAIRLAYSHETHIYSPMRVWCESHKYMRVYASGVNHLVYHLRKRTLARLGVVVLTPAAGVTPVAARFLCALCWGSPCGICEAYVNFFLPAWLTWLTSAAGLTAALTVGLTDIFPCGSPTRLQFYRFFQGYHRKSVPQPTECQRRRLSVSSHSSTSAMRPSSSLSPILSF